MPDVLSALEGLKVAVFKDVTARKVVKPTSRSSITGQVAPGAPHGGGIRRLRARYGVPRLRRRAAQAARRSGLVVSSWWLHRLAYLLKREYWKDVH
jgi:hypothetical protein